MANLITIKDTGEYPQVYTINGDSIKAIKTYASQSNVGYYTCELYTNTTDTYVFEFQSSNPSALEDNITKAILSDPGSGLVSVDTSGIYFYKPIVSNTLRYTVIAETNSGEYALPFAWQGMIDEIYNSYQFDERTSTAVVNYDCTVDWGDGSPIETFTTEDVTDYITHDYPDNVTEFTITITGTFEGWSPGLFYEYDDDYYDTGEDIKKILDWGSLKILGPHWFREMYNAEPLANNQPVLKLADIPCYLYYDSANDESVYGYGKSLESTFDYAEKLLSNGEGSFNPIDISSWDLTGVISLASIFDNYGANDGSTFDVDITQWDTSSVLSMSDMFRDCVAFNQDISGWDISNAVAIDSMFSYNEFNQDISTWDVSNVKDMDGLFSGNTVFNQDISSWDVSNVINMGYMFYGASSFNQDISGWNVSSVTEMNYMFRMAEAFNQPIGSWDVSSVTNMAGMFQGDGTGGMMFDQDISSWNVSNVTIMSNMFSFNTTFNRNINNWNTSSVTNMTRMFNGASSFNQPLYSWNLSNVTNMYGVFWGAAAFNQDIFSWDTSSVTDMTYMFRDAILFNQDLSPWNVVNVTNYFGFDSNTPAWVLPKPSF